MSARPTLLIVEDEPNLARMLVEFFDAQGYAAQAVEAGLEAIDLCWENPPQLALLDIHLPDITGYDIAQRLRASRRTREIPVIFLTSHRGRADRLHGLALGAVDYIAKPFDLQELELRVRNALQRRQVPAQARYDPITGLPEGDLVDEHLRLLAGQAEGAAIVVTVRHLDKFQEAYGFVAAADVLRAVSLKLNRVAETTAVAFVGVLETGCFVMLTLRADVPAVSRALQAEISQTLEYFYPLEDRPDPLDTERHLNLKAASVTLAADAAQDQTALRRLLVRAGR